MNRLINTGFLAALLLMASACGKESKVTLDTVRVEKGELTETQSMQSR